MNSAVTAGGGAGVLGTLATMALHHGEEWERIHDLIAELIAADKEYDEALGAFNNTVATLPSWPKRWERLNTATARRASALAALEQQS